MAAQRKQNPTSKKTNDKQAKEKKEPEVPSIVCPSCDKDTILNSAARILKDVKIMLSYPKTLLTREYHQNRIGQFYFECYNCEMPIYLKGIEVDLGDNK